MPEYDNTNSGALFFEQDKKSERHPDYKGSINVNGTEYWVSGWDKVSKKGANFISLSIQEKNATGKESPAWQQAREKFKKDDQVVPVVGTVEPDGTIDFDEPINMDDIPF